MKAAIIGAGVAGQSAAMFLARTGAFKSISVVEKFPVPEPLGSGLLLQPTGQLALERLGLLDEVRTHGARVDRLHGRSGGREVLDIRYGEALDIRGNVSYGIGIHRGTLFSALYQKLRADIAAGGVGGCELSVSFGRPVRTVRQDRRGAPPAAAAPASSGLHDAGTAAHLEYEDGSTSGPYDLVLVAEGAACHLREQLVPPSQARAPLYPYGAFWSILRDETPDGAWQGTMRQVYDGCPTMIGLLPVGGVPRYDFLDAHAAGGATAPGHTHHPSAFRDVGRDRLLSFFWSVPVAKMGHWRAQPLDAWKARVLSVWPQLEGLLAQITTHDDLSAAIYRDVIMKRWNIGNVLFIGDAAHGTSPQLGQGANMALCDSMELAHCIAEAARGSSGGASVAPPAAGSPAAATAIAGALQQYHRRRHPHLWYYQAMSRACTPVFQSDSRVIGALRDAFMRPMAKYAPGVSGLIVSTLIGTRSGLLGRWEPPPPLQPVGAAAPPAAGAARML